MTELERLELALRQVRADRDWNLYTLGEFIDCLIDNLTDKNNQYIYSKDDLESLRS